MDRCVIFLLFLAICVIFPVLTLAQGTETKAVGAFAVADSANHSSEQLYVLKYNSGSKAVNCLKPLLKTSFPDIDYAFYGYNLLRGYPLSQGRDPGFTYRIFEADFNKPRFTSDCRYIIPRGFHVAPEVACVTSFSSKVIQTLSEFSSSLSASASIEGGGWGLQFSASAGYKQSSSEIQSGESLFIISEAKCKYYFAKMDPVAPPVLDENFLQYVNYSLITNNAHMYYRFFDTYGTHYLTQTVFGARYTNQHKMSTQAYKTASQSSYSVSAQASYSGVFSIGGGFNLDSSQKEAASDFQKNVETTTVTVGATPPANGNAMEWAAEVKSDPMPVEYTLEPIEHLFVPQFMEGTGIPFVAIRQNIIFYKQLYCFKLLQRGEVTTCRPLNRPEEKFELTINVGDKDNGGSSSPVYVRLVGDLEECKEIQVSNSTLRRNTSYTFQINCTNDIGFLQALFLRTTTTDGLYLEHLILRDINTGLKYDIPCQDWFDDKEGFTLVRALYPVFSYKIRIFVASEEYSGVPHAVFVGLEGDHGTCPLQKVADGLDKNTIKIVTIKCPKYAGKIEKLHLHKDGNNEVKLDSILVEDLRVNKLYEFRYIDWIESKDITIEANG